MSVVDRFTSSPIALSLGALVLSTIVGLILTRVLRAIMMRIARRTHAEWDDLVAKRLASPVSVLITLHLLQVALDWTGIPVRALRLVENTVSVLSVVVVVWGVFRTIDLGLHVISRRAWARDRPGSRSLLTLASRFAKGAALAFGILVGLSQVGVSVASLIAGLGIGGLVFALAAQKTVENLFGAVSLGVDQPMREGDFIKIYDFVGTVESIGLRSTRVRTLDRTVVTIPNGELANQRIESYTVRDRFRFATTVGLEYSTTPAQMRAVLAAFKTILSTHPKVWSESMVVRFSALSASSLDIEIMAWFTVADWAGLQEAREEVLLQFMDAVAKVGTGFAFPTRTVHLITDQPGLAPASAPS